MHPGDGRACDEWTEAHQAVKTELIAEAMAIPANMSYEELLNCALSEAVYEIVRLRAAYSSNVEVERG